MVKHFSFIMGLPQSPPAQQAHRAPDLARVPRCVRPFLPQGPCDSCPLLGSPFPSRFITGGTYEALRNQRDFP